MDIHECHLLCHTFLEAGLVMCGSIGGGGGGGGDGVTSYMGFYT